MATKIFPGRARFRVGGARLNLWQPTRAERIAMDIARQKNAEFLAKGVTPPGTTSIHGFTPEEVESVRDDINLANGGATHGN